MWVDTEKCVDGVIARWDADLIAHPLSRVTSTSWKSSLFVYWPVQRRAEVTPGEVVTWEMMGYLHSIRGDHAAATEAFGKAVVTGAGQDNNALCLLGTSLAQQKQHSQAERVFKAASASPEFTRAWAGLARCQSAQGEDLPRHCCDLVEPPFLPCVL